jgi:hypothetical protein
MGMNQELAAMYGTPSLATEEDQTKLAEAEMFAKLAAENGINLNELSDAQIQELWDGTFGKQAEATCGKCKEAEDKCKCAAVGSEDKTASAAQAEFNQMQDWNTKVAECDKLGRIMAHAYVQELNLIKQAMDQQAGEKAAEFPPGFMPGGGKKNDHDEDDKKEPPKKDEKKDEKDEDKKEASAIDQLAAKHATKLAHAAGLDAAQAAKRVDAVITLGGIGPTEKTASAKSLDEVVHVRALELLEKAGYEVNWDSK